MQSRSGNTSSRPYLLQAAFDAFRVPDLRTRILFTLGLLVVYRFVAHVPVPGVDRAALSALFTGEFGQLLGFLDMFSGGALRNLSVAAMGVYPYITSSIIMQLMVPVIPQLKALSKEGEYGRQKINQITHYATVPIALAQGYGQVMLLQRAGVLPSDLGGGPIPPIIPIIISMAAGTIFLVWLGEQITERGIGNGISMIIFAGIVAGLPGIIEQGFLGDSDPTGLILLVGIALLIIYLIVVFTEAQRKIPVQYGRTVFRGGVARRAAGTSFIPLRINSAGMIPLIFAFAVIILPATIASYFVIPGDTGILSRFSQGIASAFDPSSFFYWLILFILVVLFALFYTMVTFSQMNLSENLQKQGGFIPGIRPGQPTAEYLQRTLMRVSWGGALFLGFVAIIPYFATLFTDVQALSLSSTAMLIVVGVALDFMRQLESQLLMRRYEGFIK
ncbi:MAG: preprotein translocase subunit SecY [Chloroflexi bacterium]|nr:preprotein translocase subunit SecY [Chloroflexota bacterium]